ncbi:MAG: SulP family inorganic anion transporter [Nitrospira sp.]|jgi:MFS superfamily sulfate permease-like transporter|nr:SulP family inorganic anion transporter [Nitrospira sp.]
MTLATSGVPPAASQVGAYKDDLFSSFVVFLVALPLCMGITVASGAPPGSGIMTAIIGGLVVGWLAGCPLQVSGPAAGLTVIVWELIHTHGVEKYGIIVLLAGLIQIVWAWLQVGHWFRAVSPAVVRGMLAGIGLLIFTGQIHVMIDDAPHGSGIANILSLPGAFMKAVVPDGPIATPHQEAAWIGLLTIAMILLWTAYAPKQMRAVPAVLIGVSTATVVTILFDLPISHIAFPDNPFTVFHFPGIDSAGHLLDPTILTEAVGLAFIASVETLLSATAVDQLHTGPRTKYNRELFSQGVGNALCGLGGVLPMTGVIVRSAANVQAGAKTRASAILHGAWLLLFVGALPFVLNMIPTASLGAVLVYTGYRLMNFGVIRDLRQHGQSEVWIYALTMGLIVLTNLLTGVMIGVGLAAAKLIYTTQNLEAHLNQDHEHGPLTLQLAGIATFVSLPRLAAAVENIPPQAEVRVCITSLRHIDHACLDLLQSWQKLHETGGGRAHIEWDKLRGLSYQTRKPDRNLSTHQWPYPFSLWMDKKKQAA